MAPGILELDEFSPSNFYAFVEDVDYFIAYTPSHSSYPSTRIEVQMPLTLIFEGDDCTIDKPLATCEVDPDTNIVTVTDLFTEVYQGGQKIKFTISKATNPTGSRAAGPWSVTTFRPYEGEYFIVDAGTADESFFAKPGYIRCELDYSVDLTFSDDTSFQFSFETEHDVPEDGYIRIELPDEMAFPDDIVENQSVNIEIDAKVIIEANGEETVVKNAVLEEITTRYALFQMPNGHLTLDNPIELSITGLRTPRSYRQSSAFLIETMTVDKFIIDAGGGDITVEMSRMNFMNSLSIQPVDLTNGAITDYVFSFDSFVHLKDKDILNVELPVRVQPLAQVICSAQQPDPVGVLSASCSANENFLTIQFDDIDKLDGEFEVIVSGIKNPSSTRKTGTASNIFMETADFFNIQ